MNKSLSDCLWNIAIYALLGLAIGLVALALVGCATPKAVITPPPKPQPPMPAMTARAPKAAMLDPSMVLPPSKLALSHPAPFKGTVTLIWDPSPDATVTGYFLYVGLSSGVYSNKMDAGFQTNCTVAGLTVSNTYYFVCTAYTENAQQESMFSNEATYTVPPIYTPNAVGLSVQGSDNPTGPWVDLPAAWVLPSTAVKQFYRLLIEPTNLPPLTNATWPLKVTIIQAMRFP